MTEATRSYDFYFDDFEVGRTLQMGTYTVTEEEILSFARQYDPQPFHVDAEAAKHSIYGGIISSGWMTCSIMMRLMVTGFLGKAASMGSPGVDEIRVPGQGRVARRREREQKGVPLSATLVTQVDEVATSLGITPLSARA